MEQIRHEAKGPEQGLSWTENNIPKEFVVGMPAGAQILGVCPGSFQPVIEALADPSNKFIKQRHFILRIAGEAVEESNRYDYVTSFAWDRTYHLFELVR